MARQLARRRHRERITGAVVVGLGLVVLIVAVIALHEPKGRVAAAQSGQGSDASNVAHDSGSGTASTSPSAASSSSPGAFDVKDMPLIVLNDTTITGLAAQAAERFQAAGWTVTSFGPYQNEIISTCAYYDPATAGAQAAAQALQQQFPTIKRVLPRFAPAPGAQPLPLGPVVVVLTPDYSPA